MTAASEAGVARASACEPGCPPRNRMPNGEHTDAAKRCADKVNLAIAAEGVEAIGKWMVVKLADGDSDGTLYPNQADAVGATFPYEREHCYLRIPRQWLSLCEAESYLRMNRMRYDAGMNVMADPKTVIPPVTREAHNKQMADFARALGLNDLSRYW